MLRCGNQLRLHKEDVDRLFELTGSCAHEIHSVEELNNFVDRHLPMFEGGTPESALLGLLLADEKINPTG